jgi:threonine dehydrogenase-like Zn-dependent dehydrogenase
MGSEDYKGDETLDPERNIFSELYQGTLAKYVVIPHRNIVVRPPEISPSQRQQWELMRIACYSLVPEYEQVK